MTQKCIFLDKDGTLIYDIPYNVDTDLIVFYEDIFEPLRSLQNAGYKFILVSNQAGIAKGLFTEQKLHAAFNYIIKQLNLNGIEILDYIYCPHDTDKYHNPTCPCRKPNPKMILDMMTKHEINMHESWMIGDILADVIAGNRAGCNTILIDRQEAEMSKVFNSNTTLDRPTYSARDFSNVDEVILEYKNIPYGKEYIK